jgi:hypothetical protein
VYRSLQTAKIVLGSLTEIPDDRGPSCLGVV